MLPELVLVSLLQAALCFIDENNEVFNNTISSQSRRQLHQGEVCSPGQVYRQDCNTCKCSNNHELMCTKMMCMDPDEFDEILHPRSGEYDLTKRSKKSLTKAELRQLSLTKKSKDKKKCVPGKMYKQDCNKCFCNDNNLLYCTMKLCEANLRSSNASTVEVIPILTNQEFVDLPTLPHQSSKCEPGKTYRVQCNTCFCLFNGNLMCTKMLCKNPMKDTLSEALSRSGKPCNENEKIDTECLKCSCENKITNCQANPKCDSLVLRTIPKKYSRTCRSTIQCDLAMDPDVEKCKPGESYFHNCNRCSCQEDFSLRCTQKRCLSYVESQSLVKQYLLLMKNEN